MANREMKHFTEETELTLKNMITEEFITASEIIFADVTKTKDSNSLSHDEKMAIGNNAFIAECNRVHYIGKLEERAIYADSKRKNGEELTGGEKESITLYNAYFNLVSIIYPIMAAKQAAMNPNAKCIKSIHSFALMDAKEKAYTVYENIIREHLTVTAEIVKRKNEKNIFDMEEWIEEERDDDEDRSTYEAIKAETIASTGDEDLAEDVAWELVYGG